MSNNKLDNLFKEKLDGLETNPRPEAWSKLHGQISEGKAKTRFIIWRVAAILLVIFSVLFVVYQNQKVGNDKGISKNQPVELNEKNQDSQINGLDSESNELAEIESRNSEVEEMQKDELNQIAMNPESTEGQENNEHQEEKTIASVKNVDAENSGLKDIVEKADNSLLNMPIDDATIADNSTSVMENNHQIESKKELETVESEKDNETGLIAKDMIAKMPETELSQTLESAETDHSGTPNVVITFIGGSESPEKSVREEDQQRFGLKKVLTIASEIKNGESGLSDLRKKKDELLALNFNKKNMSKTQDK